MTSSDDELVALRELADDIMAAATEPQLDVQQIGIDFQPKLWETLAEAGLTLLSSPEERGGAGAGLPELAVVLESSGYHAAPTPLAEHDLLASWLLGVADMAIPDGPMTAAISDSPITGDRIVADLHEVPWATEAESIVLSGPGFVALVQASATTVERDTDLAGQPLNRVSIDAEISPDNVGIVHSDLAPEFRLRGAYARSLQTCGALARALDLTIAHAQQRVQFGKPIAKFQAVQALISGAAASLALAKSATQFATEIAARHGFTSEQAQFAIAVAKIEASRAATLVARNAHQVHGAIGFTLDHRLRHFTMRALGWRSEFGTQKGWQHELGTAALRSPETTWEWVTRLSGPTVDVAAK